MTDKPDLDHLRQWIGRTSEASDIVTAQLVKGLRATLFQEIGEPKPGDPAPWTVHWCLAQPVFPMSALSADGHPTRGGFLPPVPLPRRMWAGGELEFFDALRVGDETTRTSRISDVTMKTGSTGVLCFVSVEHLVTTPRGTAVRERQDIVYRDMSTAPASAKPAAAAARRKTPRKPHGRSRAAVSLFGADLQRPPHPLRPRLRHQGRGLSRPGLPRPAAGGLYRGIRRQAPWRHARQRSSAIAGCSRCSKAASSASTPTTPPPAWSCGRRIRQGQPTMKGTATW